MDVMSTKCQQSGCPIVGCDSKYNKATKWVSHSSFTGNIDLKALLDEITATDDSLLGEGNKVGVL